MYWRCLPVALMRTSGARSLGCCDGEKGVGHRVALGAHALGVVPGTLIGALLEDVPGACPGRLLTCAIEGAVARARSGRVWASDGSGSVLVGTFTAGVQAFLLFCGVWKIFQAVRVAPEELGHAASRGCHGEHSSITHASLVQIKLCASCSTAHHGSELYCSKVACLPWTSTCAVQQVPAGSRAGTYQASHPGSPRRACQP